MVFPPSVSPVQTMLLNTQLAGMGLASETKIDPAGVFVKLADPDPLTVVTEKSDGIVPGTPAPAAEK
jgi:hypothetical protein